MSPGGDWVNDVRWNLCLADIGGEGKAVNPRFLLPPALRHEGDTIARTDPYALYSNGQPLKGPYDQHFRYRRRDDKHPMFSADDTRVYYSTKSPRAARRRRRHHRVPRQRSAQSHREREDRRHRPPHHLRERGRRGRRAVLPAQRQRRVPHLEPRPDGSPPLHAGDATSPAR